MIWGMEVADAVDGKPFSVADRKVGLHTAALKLRVDIDDMNDAEIALLFANGPVILSLSASSLFLKALQTDGTL